MRQLPCRRSRPGSVAVVPGAHFNLGILAHADAGKTSLTGRLLFEAGAVPGPGSVNAGTVRTGSMNVSGVIYKTEHGDHGALARRRTAARSAAASPKHAPHGITGRRDWPRGRM